MVKTFSIKTKATGPNPRPRSWGQLSMKQRRIAIAQDAIAWLNGKAWQRQKGHDTSEPDIISIGSGYVEGGLTPQIFAQMKDKDEISREAVDHIKENCTMCARGFMLVSKFDCMVNGEPIKVDKASNLAWAGCNYTGQTIYNISVDSTANKNLLEEFSAAQQCMMEAVFEGDGFYIASRDFGGDKEAANEARKNCRYYREHFEEKFVESDEEIDSLFDIHPDHWLDGYECLVYSICQNIIDNDGTFDPTDHYEIA